MIVFGIFKNILPARLSFKASSRKLKKYYLIHPSLDYALPSPKKGKLIENLVQFKSKSKNYWREGKNEVDFIQTIENKIIPIESKYTKNIRIKELKGLIKFMEKFKVKEGIIVNEEDEKEEKIQGKKIIFKPLWKWLLEK